MANPIHDNACFQLTNLDVTSNKIIWSTTNEIGKLPFIIEQYRWNKWIKVGFVNGKGGAGPNNYSAVVRLNSGKNRFRLKQTDMQGNKKLSKEIEYTNPIPAVTFSPNKVDSEITFSAETMYEIYDEFGAIVVNPENGKVAPLICPYHSFCSRE